jgi:hypothetical protein
MEVSKRKDRAGAGRQLHGIRAEKIKTGFSQKWRKSGEKNSQVQARDAATSCTSFLWTG